MLKKIMLTTGIIYFAFLLQTANDQRKIEPEQAKKIAESYL